MADKHRRVRSAAVTGVGQLLGLLGSTLIGVLVAGTLKPSPRVDAFFAANQIYALSLYLGQAVRITAPALMVRSGLEAPKLNRASLWLSLGTVAAMILVAVVGQPLVSASAGGAFTSDLLILAPAAGVHVASGGLAARMAVVGSFGYAAGAYAAGSVVSGLLLLITIDSQGAAALAPCIAAGGVTIGLIMALAFHRIGRMVGAESPATALAGPGPDRATLATKPNTMFALRRIGLGAVPALSMQLLITAVTLAAGHVVSGGTALLSYSFLALFAFTTIAITPMSIVLGPEVAERWNGSQSDLVGIIRQATRLSMVLAVPLVALAFILGRPLAGILLSALTDHDLDQVFAMLAVLTPSLLLTAAATAATVGITAADRLGTLALGLLSTGGIAVTVGVVLAVTADSLLEVATAATLFSLTYAGVTLRVAVPGKSWDTSIALLIDNAPVFIPALAYTAVTAPLSQHSVPLGIVVGALAVVLHALVVLVLRRDTVTLLIGAARRKQVALCECCHAKCSPRRDD